MKNKKRLKKIDNVEEYWASITSITKGEIVNAYITFIKNKYDTVNKLEESRDTSVSNRPN